MCSLKSLLAKDPTPKLTAWPGKLPYIPLSAIEPKEESLRVEFLLKTESGYLRDAGVT